MTVIPPWQPETFESYEAARASLEEIGFRQRVYDDLDNPDSYHEVVVDTFHCLLEQDYPGYGTLMYGEVGTGTMSGTLAFAYFLTEDGRRYRLPLPGNWRTTYRRTEVWDEVEAGLGFYMTDSEDHPTDMITWWMNCVYETHILPEGDKTVSGGRCYWTFFLPTMETFVWFRPEE